MTFSPTENILIEYKGSVGVVKFVCEQSLSFCIYDNDGELSNVCIVVYSYDWDNIKLLSGHHK